MSLHMIVATNRKLQNQRINEPWSDQPEKSGHLNWLIVEFETASDGCTQIKNATVYPFTPEELPEEISTILNHGNQSTTKKQSRRASESSSAHQQTAQSLIRRTLGITQSRE